MVSRRTLLATVGATVGGAIAGCIGEPGDRRDSEPEEGPRGGYTPGQAGDRFYQNGPPSRSGQIIEATDYRSLQEAHDALQPGDTLHIPSSGGPYQEQLSISKDHVTIASQDGAWIEQPSEESWALGSSSENRTRETSLAHPVAGGGAKQDGVSNESGDTTLRVVDTSPFSAGDDIYIVEETRPYGDPRSGGAKGPDTTEELRTITDIDHDSNTLHVQYPMFLPYPAKNETIVGHVEWAATDVRVTGLNVRGPGGNDGSHTVQFNGIKNGWFDSIRIEGSPDHSLAIYGCYQCRTDNIRMFDGGGYGIVVSSGSTHTLCTNSVGDGIQNYVVRSGGSAVDTLADGVVGRNFQSSNEGPVCASHWGGFYMTYRNVTAESEQLARYRTRQMIVEDFIVSGSSTKEVVWSQRPFDVLVRDGDIGNYPNDANEVIFYFRLRGDSQAGGDNRFGNEEARNIRIEDVRIEQLEDHGPEDIGDFDENAIIDGLYIRNVTYGGQRLTRQHVEQWNGYGSADITNLVVE